MTLSTSKKEPRKKKGMWLEATLRHNKTEGAVQLVSATENSISRLDVTITLNILHSEN